MLTTNEALNIMLKEYDVLAQEISEKTNTFQARGLPVLALLIGGLIGWHNNISVDWFILFLPTFAITMLDISVSAWYYMDRAGRWLAMLEGRIYDISKRPLLTHQTSLVIARQAGRRVWSWLLWATGVPLLYGGLEYEIYRHGVAKSSNIHAHAGAESVIWLVISLPALRLCTLSVRMYFLRRMPFNSLLMSRLLSNSDTEDYDS